MKRDDFTLPLAFPGELVIDNFAGGGGTSTGLERAFGRPVDIAINHDPEALAMHALNHPHTQHLCESVWEVNPIEVTRNQPVALVWLSPDCKHFSKAKGGTPVAKHIRGLAWVGMRWAALCKPRVLMLENVEEFKEWGPLIVGADGKARPCPVRKGKTFESFVRQLKGLGYNVDYRELRACDYGAPTIRKRLFLIARRDGLPIVWPEPTHAEPTDRRVLAGKLAAYRSAAECIDFALPAQSVFDRKKDLVPNTMRRVAKGLWRHVLTSASPFIVNTRNGERAGQQPRIRSIDEPFFTVTAQGSQGALAAPVLAPLRGTSGNQLVGHSVQAPLSTVAASGTHHALAMAHITKFNTGAVGSELDAPLPTITAGGTPKRPSTGITMGLVAAHLIDMGHGEGKCGTKRFSHGIRSIELPLNTVTASGATSALAAACLEQANGGFYDGDGRAADAPMSTITAAGSNQRLVTAYMVKYYGNERDGVALAEPMHTIPTKDRMGLVQTVKVPAATLAPEHAQRALACAQLLHQYLPEQFPDAAEMVLMPHQGQLWVLVDITLRMLKPRELYQAQGFPLGYQFTEIPDPALLFTKGQQAANPLKLPRIPLTATSQVRMCGNSVSPPVSESLVRANFAHEARMYGVTA